jgi:hypothetical protein
MLNLVHFLRLLPSPILVILTSAHSSKDVNSLVSLSNPHLNMRNFVILRRIKHVTWSRLSKFCPTTTKIVIPTIRSRLTAPYDALLGRNLLRIVELYSVSEIEYMARQDVCYPFTQADVCPVGADFPQTLELTRHVKFHTVKRRRGQGGPFRRVCSRRDRSSARRL